MLITFIMLYITSLLFVYLLTCSLQELWLLSPNSPSLHHPFLVTTYLISYFLFLFFRVCSNLFLIFNLLSYYWTFRAFYIFWYVLYQICDFQIFFPPNVWFAFFFFSFFFFKFVKLWHLGLWFILEVIFVYGVMGSP